jgi:uncharacterized protein (DUF362 family)
MREDNLVVVVQGSHLSKQDLLRETLESVHFWSYLDHQHVSSGKPIADFKIVIHPNLQMFAHADTRGTDPELVEYLIELLNERGFSQVCVGATSDEWSFWLDNRQIEALADLVGYHYLTPAGFPYTIVDLAIDLDPTAFPESSILASPGLGRVWVNADFRINFAKNKTDEAQGYSLGVQNLLGLLPLTDKQYHYWRCLEAHEVCLELLWHAPPHFTLIDAYTSNHGQQGSRGQNPLPTATLIASFDTVLADFVGALKMGLDPFVSSLTAQVLRRRGLSTYPNIVGDLQAYPKWENVHPLVQRSVQGRESNRLSRVVIPWLQVVDQELFPFKDIVDEQLHRALQGFLASPKTATLGQALYTLMNFVINYLERYWEAWEIMIAKQRLLQQERQLGFDPAEYSPEAFEAVIEELEGVRAVLRQCEPTSPSFRWRYLDGAVICEGQQTLLAPYEAFVDKVDVSSTIRLMNDYIGGAHQGIRFDATGRVTHQAERNIYLPQPNWLAFFGGSFIDVGKLEVIRYGEGQQSIYWRTIASANHSAEFDDGIVDFVRAADGGTQVHIFTRQKFSLPLFWKVFDIDLVPEIKRPLVEAAYTKFFQNTLQNLMAQFQNQTARIGKPADTTRQAFSSTDEQREKLKSTVIRNVRDMLASIVRGNSPEGRFVQSILHEAVMVDEDGFYHYQPMVAQSMVQNHTDDFSFQENSQTLLMSDWAELAQGLVDAIEKDLGRQRD